MPVRRNEKGMLDCRNPHSVMDSYENNISYERPIN